MTYSVYKKVQKFKIRVLTSDSLHIFSCLIRQEKACLVYFLASCLCLFFSDECSLCFNFFFFHFKLLIRSQFFNWQSHFLFLHTRSLSYIRVFLLLYRGSTVDTFTRLKLIFSSLSCVLPQFIAANITVYLYNM